MKIPVKEHNHGNAADRHETIDAFDSHSQVMGDSRSAMYDREVSQAERRRWKREDAAREKRRRPAGFAAWPP